jgi:hypothetical protein
VGRGRTHDLCGSAGAEVPDTVGGREGGYGEEDEGDQRVEEVVVESNSSNGCWHGSAYDSDQQVGGQRSMDEISEMDMVVDGV